MKSARRQTAFWALAPGSVIIPIQSSYGQSQAINGSIRGRVTDPADALVNVSSRDEQNITANATLNGDTLATSHPLYVARNTVRTPSLYEFDMRDTRTFIKLRERFQPNNIFNHPNITSINTTATATTGAIVTSPTFAPVSTLLEGRIVQLGVRVDW